MPSLTRHIGVARWLARVLDRRFEVFGVKFGLDPIIGLIPGWGDVIGMLLSLYLVWLGYRLKISSSDKRKMLFNVIWDGLFGLIPFMGDAADIFFTANLRNTKILEKYFDDEVVEEGEIVS